MNAWGGSPFCEASSADALVSVHEDQKSDYKPLVLRSVKP
jgi:hypothetical protein